MYALRITIIHIPLRPWKGIKHSHFDEAHEGAVIELGGGNGKPGSFGLRAGISRAFKEKQIFHPKVYVSAIFETEPETDR